MARNSRSALHLPSFARRGVRDWLMGFLTICAAIIILVLAGDRLWNWVSSLGVLADRTTEAAPVYVTIANRQLSVPANLIRFSYQRDGGTQNRLDLALHWPDFGGYSEAQSADFEKVGNDAPVVYLAIRPRETTTDTAGRLATIYDHFLGNPVGDAPAGLVGYALQPESGLSDENVYFEPGSTSPYAVHCQIARPAGSDGPEPLCLREIHAGEAISVQIRFHRGLLPHWKEVDQGVKKVLAGIGLFSQS